MAQTGYTPILTYSSSTAAAAPSAGNLTNSTLGSELAINITDGKLFYKDNANAVQVIGWKVVPTSAGGTGLSGATPFTANGILFASSASALSTSSALTWNGSTLATTGALTIDGNATLGNASTDTVTVNGTMGVGGANSFPAQYGAHIKNSALTGTNIYGAVSEVTGPATATASINAFTSIPTTSANAFTVGIVRGFQAINAIKGVGSTITDQHGVWVADQTQGTNNFGVTSLVSSGTNKWNVYASGTAANYFAGNVLINTTTAAGYVYSSGRIQLAGTTEATSVASLARFSANAGSPILNFAKSRGASIGTNIVVQSNDDYGILAFVGADGTSYVEAARIRAQVDGTPNTNDMPGRLVFSTTASGSSSPTERVRINNAGITQFNSNLVMPYQGAPTSKSGAATLTGAELITGILNTTGTTYTITLPTGTDIEGALSWSANNVSLDWWVINTASGTITIGANGNTTLGGLTIVTNDSAHFRIRRTAANTFTVYRLS
jgi:hypothetical protein